MSMEIMCMIFVNVRHLNFLSSGSVLVSSEWYSPSPLKAYMRRNLWMILYCSQNK